MDSKAMVDSSKAPRNYETLSNSIHRKTESSNFYYNLKRKIEFDSA
jgi:hypothetical protein